MRLRVRRISVMRLFVELKQTRAKAEASFCAREKGAGDLLVDFRGFLPIFGHFLLSFGKFCSIFQHFSLIRCLLHNIRFSDAKLVKFTKLGFIEKNCL